MFKKILRYFYLLTLFRLHLPPAELEGVILNYSLKALK